MIDVVTKEVRQLKVPQVSNENPRVGDYTIMNVNEDTIVFNYMEMNKPS